MRTLGGVLAAIPRKFIMIYLQYLPAAPAAEFMFRLMKIINWDFVFWRKQKKSRPAAKHGIDSLLRPARPRRSYILQKSVILTTDTTDQTHAWIVYCDIGYKDEPDIITENKWKFGII